MQPLHATGCKPVQWAMQPSCNRLRPGLHRLLGLLQRLRSSRSVAATAPFQVNTVNNVLTNGVRQNGGAAMRSLILSIVVAATAAVVAMTAPSDPGRALEGAPAPLLKAASAR